ncbi:unnamed protein product [Discula destructiva]
MEKLNDDVLALIISHLCAKAPPSPPPISLTWHLGALPKRPSSIVYASVNKRWQVLVETRTFSTIALKSKDLSTFATIFDSPRRRACLRRLGFTIALPTHGDSRASFARNLQVFRSVTRHLFEILSQWDGSQGRFELHFDAVWDIEIQDNEPVDLFFQASKSSASRRYLTLPDQPLLSPVQCITSFTNSNCGGRAFHPSALCSLALAMPRLTHLSLSYLDPVPARQALRRDHRCALASGLLSLSSLAALSHLTIDREPMSSIHNHSFSVGTLNNSSGIDDFSAALEVLAGRPGLADLRLEDTLVSAQLFLGVRTWPTLRRLTINSRDILAPSGAWYYKGNPDAVEAEVDSAPGSPSLASSTEHSDSEGEEDEVLNGERPAHQWRMHPDPLTFNPLVAAFTDAVVSRMPVLKSAWLQMGMNMSDFIGVEIEFMEAGVKIEDRPGWKKDSKEEIMVRRCYCWIGRAAEWEVPEEVLAVWKEWAGSRGRVEIGRWPPM